MFDFLNAVLDGMERNRRAYEAMSPSERFWHDLKRDLPTYLILFSAIAITALAVFGLYKLVF